MLVGLFKEYEYYSNTNANTLMIVDNYSDASKYCIRINLNTNTEYEYPIPGIFYQHDLKACSLNNCA